jgi:hypothetical protein
MGAGAVSAAAPVVWNFLGYHFQARPLIVAVCATLMTRLIVSLNTNGPRRWALDVTVTALYVLVPALWVQANDLALLPAGLSGIMFGALDVSIISVAKSQAAAAFRAARQTFVRSLGSVKPPENPGA